jgi:signal peptidase
MTVKRCVVAAVVIMLGVVAAAAVSYWHDGYRVYAVQTGSMTPTYRPGDLVVDAPASGPYRVGDVVTFRSAAGSGRTTHRVHGYAGEALRTKGDANRSADPVPIALGDVVGRVIGAVPRGGYAVVFLQQPTGAASLMALVLTLWMSWGLFFPQSPARPQSSRQPARQRLHPAGS